jgi:hypothetical protein
MNLAMNFCRRFLAALFVFALASGGAGIAAAPASLAAAQKDNGGKPSITAAIFSPDKGKFRILLDGQAIGNEEFEISSSGGAWMARGSTSAHVPGGTEIKAFGQLTLSGDGAPIHYDWSAEALKKASGVVEFANGTAKCAANLGGTSPMMKDFKFDSPRIAVLDNNLYHQYAVLAQVYDWKSGGKQTFPVVIPQDLTPGSISVESLGSQPGENAKYEALRVSTTDLEILLYVDARHHLMRLEVPASKVVVERQ